MRRITWFVVSCLFPQIVGSAHAFSSDPVALFEFEGNLSSVTGTSVKGVYQGEVSFAKGLDGKAMRLTSHGPLGFLTLDGKSLKFDKDSDFSVQCWIRTSMDSSEAAVILSQKEFADCSLASQKLPGWVFYFYRGTWAWNMGSGTRRLTYERQNGQYMPLNDGKWHQLAMTYDSAKSEVRLFYDGDNKVLYNVEDAVGFDFTSNRPLSVGGKGVKGVPPAGIRPEIMMGAEKLQELVNEFNRLGAGNVEPGQFESLIVSPKRLFEEKVDEMKTHKGADGTRYVEAMKSTDLESVEKLRAELKKNPYTVHQVRDFMKVAPLLRIYSLVDGRVTINEAVARTYTKRVRLAQPDLDMDKLAIWDRVLSPEEVRKSYSRYFKPDVPSARQTLPSIVAGVWNIHHGGKHYTVEKDGWDSRLRIAEILRKNNVDVIMMQETYSSGDSIAAELGYYFATTVDWDYLNQGANISVLSRYPIEDIYVCRETPFNNVAAKIALSETQDIYVMSNWYGMNSFPVVFDFHESRFDESDTIPTLFAGDFNAIPHTDGGRNPASRKMLEAGFSDAFRSLYPDVKKYPGASHRSGSRIDQLYYKGNGLKNTSTKVVSGWPGGFPSDHFLIISEFDLNYSSIEEK